MPPRFILGLHSGHNASACIGDESGLIYAVQEERLRGEKNYWGTPTRAMVACLRHVGAATADQLSIAHGGNQAICKYHSRDDVLRAYRRRKSVWGQFRQRIAVPFVIGLRPNWGQQRLKAALAAADFGSVPLSFHDHHTTHAATAYYGLRTSPDEKYLVLTCDGDGDRLCASVRIMGGGDDRLVAATHWDNSLGALYSWITFGMGFVPLEHEYKLMGMAPYASDHAAAEMAQVFAKYLHLDAERLEFRRSTFRRTNDLAESLFRELKGKRFDHICAGLQRFTEDLLCQWTAAAVKATGVRRVLAAGGVFMNVKANKRIGELDGVESFEAFPSCSDETLSIGAYYLEAAKRFSPDRLPPLKHFYLGDDLDKVDTAAAVRSSGFHFSQPADMAATAAEILAAGQPIARCAGPMEFGARALGNRSILADPRNQDVVRVINQMVKKRDFWMPFAPMVMAARQDEYLKNPKRLTSPYMMMTFDTRDNFREMIAAVHNADLTCRAQILEADQNPPMHAILQAFAERTGRGVILNTSFNLHGWPIVRTAADALHVFKNSGLEYLLVGEYLVRKK
ncbi:MAG TPA: carbamoyltransferase C-terminal domain-containing protein [Pirellulales bacterium]|jgi:carbamoyltransferase|nr:carbamoyltransferase C-terminal domain-containing protein [Pirellulales bacterium]